MRGGVDCSWPAIGWASSRSTTRERGGQLVFGSEIKALLARPGAEPRLDAESLSAYLTFAAVPAPNTLFADIRKLPPGHRLIVDDGVARVERYWQPLPDADLARRRLPTGEYVDLAGSDGPRVDRAAHDERRAVRGVPVRRAGLEPERGADGRVRRSDGEHLLGRDRGRRPLGRAGRRAARGRPLRHYPSRAGHRRAGLPRLPAAARLAAGRAAGRSGVRAAARHLGRGAAQRDARGPGWRRLGRAVRRLPRVRLLRRLSPAGVAAVSGTAARRARIGVPRRRATVEDWIGQTCSNAPASGGELFWGGAIAFFDSHKRRLLHRPDRGRQRHGAAPVRRRRRYTCRTRVSWSG